MLDNIKNHPGIVAGVAVVLIGAWFMLSGGKQAAVDMTENNQADATVAEKVLPVIYPVEHASMVMEWDGEIYYIDPVGEAAAYTAYGLPSLIAITHAHGDHLDIPLLEQVVTESVTLIVTDEVFNQLPESLQAQSVVLQNGDLQEEAGAVFEAIPAYNTTADKLQFHPQGVGNGYVIEKSSARVYVAGDTEDIPEMRALRNIDIAFVPMNQPFTMTVEAAASAVLEFAPAQVYPYHYRGREGFSDLTEFEALVKAGNSDIEVVYGDWYTAEEMAEG